MVLNDRRGCFIGWSAVGFLWFLATVAVVITGIIGDYAGSSLTGWQGMSVAATVAALVVYLGYDHYSQTRTVASVLIGTAFFGMGFAIAEIVFLSLWLVDCPSTDLSVDDLCPGGQCDARHLSCLDGGYWQLIAAAIVAGLWIVTDIAYIVIAFGYRSEAHSKLRAMGRKDVVEPLMDNDGAAYAPTTQSSLNARAVRRGISV